tara:strand:- start:3203 stop:3598 length:396 start_codon:yes stop_codon:yes gene_type:complete
MYRRTSALYESVTKADPKERKDLFDRKEKKGDSDNIVSKFFTQDPYGAGKVEILYVSSSNVVALSYNPVKATLMIEFKRYIKGVGRVNGGGPRYAYYGVSPTRWANIRQAPSFGKMVWGLRRTGVPYQKIR